MPKSEMTRYLKRPDVSFSDKVGVVLASEVLASAEVADILYHLAREEFKRLARRCREIEMPSFVCHHDGRFFMWSTVVDAPISEGMRRQDFEDWYVWRYGEESRATMNARIERALRNGTSDIGGLTLRDLVRGNRAGPDESELSFEELVGSYTVGREE